MLNSYPQAKRTMCKSNYNKTLSNRYKTVIKLWRVCTLKSLARGVYAGAYKPGRVINTLIQSEYLSIVKNDKYKKIKIKSLLVLVSVALIAPQGANSAYAANYSVDHLKLYAHSRLLDYKEFMCFNKLITQESRWSYTARNGSHYGLGQMRSTHYRDLDPYRQIDSTISYITKRYKTVCKAWAFHLKHRYY